jgi:hypothetical protein
MSVGAHFVCANLHSRPRSGEATFTSTQHVETALARELAVMAISDHTRSTLSPLS